MRFPFNKNSGFKVWISYMFIGTVHSSCIDPIQATARLVIILKGGIQKSDTGTTILSNGKEISVIPTEMTGRVAVYHHQIFRSNRTEMVRLIWFLTEISGVLG